MSVQKPTSVQIADLAAEIGYTDIAASPEEYTAMISGMVGVLDALNAIPEPEVLVSRDTVDCTVPTADEDPHHAWEVRTSIPGAESGLLAGVRLGVKDSILVAGVPMRNGSKELESFVPNEDATIVTRALAAGAEVVGKTTNEYFCMSGGSHTAASGVVHNPHRMGYSSGGSSSGSAVALVTGDADMTFGADQAGSIRMPASWSGVVGLKPTYGLVPYTGIGTLDGYFDHVGPMTRTVADNARLLTVIAGSDGIDFRQKDIVVGDYLSRINDGVKGLKIGVLTEGFGTENAEAMVDKTVRDTVEALRQQGAIVEEVSIPLHSLGGRRVDRDRDRGHGRDGPAQPGPRLRAPRLLPGRHDAAPVRPQERRRRAPRERPSVHSRR
ncbi:amidase family protein [Curtobacterium flaccumfaciens]|nr:amidase family protein [Curtobacterium flaccumfaciens]